jgi:hypothetical protein
MVISHLITPHFTSTRFLRRAKQVSSPLTVEEDEYEDYVLKRPTTYGVGKGLIEAKKKRCSTKSQSRSLF